LVFVLAFPFKNAVYFSLVKCFQLKKNIAFPIFVSEVKPLAIFYFQLISLVAIEHATFFINFCA
jgi:hypothetical protein